VKQVALLGLVCLGGAGLAQAQAAPDSLPRPRSLSVTAGIGNAMGWLGLQGEKYLAQSRLSLFLGAGYTPAADEGDAKGAAFATGIRGFTPGIKHRGFLELSISQVAVQQFCFDACHRYYGPGLQAGYQFVSRGGFTLMLSAGIGVLFDPRPGDDRVGGLGGIGLGYTWRRH